MAQFNDGCSNDEVQQRGRLQRLHTSESRDAGPVCCNVLFGGAPSSQALWRSVAGWSNAHVAGLRSDNGSLCQFIPILREHLLAYRALLAHADVDETHDAAVRQATSDRQFPEILVHRDEHALFSVRLRQDVFITWILRQIAGSQHVMAGCLKFSLGAAPNASIELQLHAADSILRGSIRSWPTMRRA